MPYNAILQVDRNRIINAYECGEDYQHVATTLSIALQTALNIVKRFRQRGHGNVLPRGGRRHVKIDDEMVQYMVTEIECKPTITLMELNNGMRTANPDKPHVMTQAVSKRLDGELISLKDIRAVPVQWKTPKVHDSAIGVRELAHGSSASHPQDICGRVWGKHVDVTE